MNPSARLIIPLVFVIGHCLPAQADALAKAKKAAEAKDYAAAVEILEADEAYEAVSKDPVALRLLADCALKADLLDTAVTRSIQAIELDPKNSEGLAIAARAFFGRGEKARADAEGGDIRITSGTVMSYYESSAEYCTKYLESKSDDAEMLVLKGHSFYWLEQAAHSAAAFEKAIAVEPSNLDNYFFLARAHRANSNFGAGEAAMKQAITKNADAAWLYKEMADIVGSANSPEAEQRALPMYGQALTAKNLDATTRGQAPNAIWALASKHSKLDEGGRLMEAWTKAHPKDAFAWWWLGTFQQNLRDDAAALKSFEKSFNVSNENRALAASSAGDALARLAVPSQGGNPDMSRLDPKKYREAVKWYLEAYKNGQGVSWGNYDASPMGRTNGIFLAMLANGKAKEGAEMIEKDVLPVAPDEWRILNNLALYHRDEGQRLGRSSESKEHCKKSLALYVRATELVTKDGESKPEERAQVFNDTGVLYHFPMYHVGDVAKGLEYYRMALTHSAECIDALENVGICLNALGKPEEAVGFFEKVLEKQPGRAVSLRGLQRAKSGK